MNVARHKHFVLLEPRLSNHPLLLTLHGSVAKLYNEDTLWLL